MADDWRSNQYRQSVVTKIEEAIRNSRNPTSKNAIEMESHFYQKAKTREDYLGYLARLLLHVNEMSKKNAQQNQIQMQGGPGIQDSMGQGQGSQGMGMAQMGNQGQPSALIAQLNQRQMNPNQGPMGQPGPNQQQHENWDMMGQQNPMLQQHMNMTQQNFNPNQGMNQGMMNQNVLTQPIMNMNQGQPMQQGSGMMASRPRMQVPLKMAPNPGGPQLGGMMTQQPQFMQQQQQNQMLQQHQLQQQMQQQQQRKMEMQAGPGPGMVGRQGPQSHYVGLSPAAQGVQSVASPAMSGGGMTQQMAPSPHYANSPGGSQGIAPSPGSATGMQRLQPGQQQQGRPSTNMGAPSPGIGSVNTPQNIHLQTGNMGGQMDAQMVEEQMYIEKVRELGRKYIEPLRRMIEKIGNEDTEKLSKMRNLLNLLENPQKRVPMDTLIKCESVLEKMDFKKTDGGSSAPGSVQPPSVSFAVPIPVKEPSQFQQLIEAVAANIKSPLINHTLKRTFGPAVTTLAEPADLDFDYFAPKRRRYEEEEEESEPEPGEIARDTLEKEIGTVDRKFVVEIMKEGQASPKGLSVVCKILDKHIPSVPDMEVFIPETYPFSSPVFQLPGSEKESNPFHRRVLQNMEARISRMQYTFSLSQFLDIWESSIRQACNPKHPGGDQILLALNKMAGL